jgi:hypothetical protein
MKSFTRAIALTTLLGVAGTTSACYGKFALTRKVYELNGQITDNKFVHSLVMWAFQIIPVYGCAAAVDVVVLNLIEFWTGSNPMGADVKTDDGTTVSMKKEVKDGVETMTITATKEGQLQRTLVLVKKGDVIEGTGYDAAGKQVDHKIFGTADLSAEAMATATL